MFKPVWTLLVAFRRSPVFSSLALAVLGVGLYSSTVVYVDQRWLGRFVLISAQLHVLLGLVLGLLLVFRTNTSYDRWWEARKLWGQLVNDSRNLAIKVATCVRTDEADKHRLGVYVSTFAWALKNNLQGGRPLQAHAPFRDAVEQPGHVPIFLAGRIYEHVERWRQTGKLDGFEFWVVDQHLMALMNVCGACERILKTPIAFSYLWFIRQAIAVYLATLPWGLVESFGYWSVPATMLLGYLLIGVELLAESIENPFGDSIDDLSLEAICRTIERDVAEVLPPPMVSAGEPS
ncbi:MAG: bestrophin family ion channel [Pirellulales bacterium]